MKGLRVNDPENEVNEQCLIRDRFGIIIWCKTRNHSIFPIYE